MYGLGYGYLLKHGILMGGHVDRGDIGSQLNKSGDMEHEHY
jgi:hypothetical protein